MSKIGKVTFRKISGGQHIIRVDRVVALDSSCPVGFEGEVGEIQLMKDDLGDYFIIRPKKPR